MKRQHNRGLRKIRRCARKRWASCPYPWHFNFKHGDIHYWGSLERLLDRPFDTRDEAQAQRDDAYMMQTLSAFKLDGAPSGRKFVAGITEDDLERFM